MKTFSISSKQDVLEATPLIGTLLWIGEREGSVFRDAYRYCETTSSQIAFRSTLEDARRRPASDVQRIVVSRVDRSQPSSEDIELVARRHSNASWLALEGPLCGGATRRQLNQPLSNHCYLHQWHQHLPDWLAQSDETAPDPAQTSLCIQKRSRSLAIIASNNDNADTLMDLAEASDCTSAWFRTPHSARMRNFDVIWWDDSVATEATCEQWQHRLEPKRSSPFRKGSRHVWLTNSTSWSTIENAYAGGVACVLTKPFRVNALEATLELAPTLALDTSHIHASDANESMRRRLAA